MPWPVWYIMKGSGYLQKETLEEHHCQYCIGGRKDLHYWALALLRTYSYWSILEIVKLSPSRAVSLVCLTIAPAKGTDTVTIKVSKKKVDFRKSIGIAAPVYLEELVKKCDSILTMTKHRSVAESAPALRLSNSATYLSMFIEPFLINIIQTFKIRF